MHNNEPLEHSTNAHGFSLVELSIVLVILGLLVGGVLSGQALIKSAQMRSQLAQIDAYRTATNTFRDKYFAFPGDLPATTATQLGYMARSGAAGSGDGNGAIEGLGGVATIQGGGESILFWADLSRAGLIEGSYTAGSGTAFPAGDVTGAALAGYYPPAKIGGGNYVYIWSGEKLSGNAYRQNGVNSLGIVAFNGIYSTEFGYTHSTPNIEVSQAYGIDMKIDDGMPMTGKVVAQYVGYSYAPSWTSISREENEPPPIALAPSNLTCIDNGNSAGAGFRYTTSFSDNKACALSFRLN